jgi:penicillin-binding protein-related factor A (putative recombinase)
MKLIKEDERYILTDLITHKRKKKIKEKSIEIKRIQQKAQYCADIQNPVAITFFSLNLQKLSLLIPN